MIHKNPKQDRTVGILGCGWLGIPLGKRLADLGMRVRGSTTRRERFPALEAAGIEPHRLVLEPDLNGDRPEEFFECDVLVVALPPGRRRQDVETFHPRQIRALMPWIEGNGIPFVIFVSSTSVYPDVNRVVREEDADFPPTPSGRALLKAERILSGSPAFRTTIVRFGGLIGGERNPARFLAGKGDVPNPDAPVNLIHRDDCVRILSLLIDRDLRGEILNACCDGHPTKREFYTGEARKLGIPPPLFAEAPADADNPRGGKTVSSDKLKRLLNYEFLYPDPAKAFPPEG